VKALVVSVLSELVTLTELKYWGLGSLNSLSDNC
jgi:hypothetical protein